MYHDNLCINTHLFMFLEKPRIFTSGVTEDRGENTLTKQTSHLQNKLLAMHS